MASQAPKGTKEKESIGDKVSETFSNLKQNEKIESLYRYAQDNSRDAVAYVLLILGILFSLSSYTEYWGGALIGLVVGIYLYAEIMTLIRNINGFIEEQGTVRSLVLGGMVLGFFIFAPMIFIGAAIGLGFKHLIGQK